MLDQIAFVLCSKANTIKTSPADILSMKGVIISVEDKAALVLDTYAIDDDDCRLTIFIQECLIINAAIVFVYD